MFAYTFMIYAFIVGIIIALIVPLIGTVVVLRKTAMVGDALAHISLAGVAAGLILRLNPVVGATVMCLIATFAISSIQKYFKQHGELAIAVIMSAGIGLAGVLSGFVSSAVSFNSFLFGSIVAVSKSELMITVILGLSVLLLFLLFYREIYFFAVDEKGARRIGMPIGVISTLFAVMTALTVSIASRTVGALIVSSLMVLPVATAMVFAKSFWQTISLASTLSVIYMATGLTLAFYVPSLRPGGTIALLAVIALVIAIIAKQICQKSGV